MRQRCRQDAGNRTRDLANGTQDTGPAGPLAEGIKKMRGQRRWAHMGDEELLGYAGGAIRAGSITSRAMLAEADKGLSEALRTRGLMDELGLPDLNRDHLDWEAIGDKELVRIGRAFIAERGISKRRELGEADRKLYRALLKRDLLDEAGLPSLRGGNRRWRMMDDETLVAFAKGFIAERGINGRTGLIKADRGLYCILGKRGLMDDVGLPDTQKECRDWASRSDAELAAHARRFICGNGICSREQLRKADTALYAALRRRGLLGDIGLENPNGSNRKWAGIDDEDLMAIARSFIAERGIGTRMELRAADSRLYEVLRKRKLLGETRADVRLRGWRAMTHEELLGFARSFIAERGIRTRKELKEADDGLNQALGRRGLLGDVGLEHIRKKSRRWIEMGTEEQKAAAKRFITEMGIRGRRELHRADGGMYEALRRMRLLDAVFSDIESSKNKDAVLGVVDSLESFGDQK